MRARWVKPEFFKDRKIAELGPVAALVYEALWCMADDGGTAPCDAEVIKGEAFMWWSAVGVPEITGALRALFEAGRIEFHRTDDEWFCSIPRFGDHQKVHKPSTFRYSLKRKGFRDSLPWWLEDSGTGSGDSGTPHIPDSQTPRHLATTTTTNAGAREEQPGQIVQHEAEPDRESGIGNRKSEPSEKPSRPPPGSADARLIAKFDFDAAQLVGDFLDEMADHPKRAAVIGYLTMWASGHSMPPAEKATPDEIATGLAAYRAFHVAGLGAESTVPPEKRDYSERHVWGFIRSIVRRRTNPAPARASPNSSRERSPPDKNRKPSHAPSLRSE